jgi:hypothetical protein
MTDDGVRPTGLELPDLIEYDGAYWDPYEDTIYAIFKRDFLDNRCMFRGRPITIQIEPRFKGKVEGFWHVTTETGPSGKRDDRVQDLARCARVGWLRPILCAPAEQIVVWGEKRGNYQHLGVALADFSFVIFLREWPDGYQLKTAYCVTSERKRMIYRRAWEANKR